MELLKWNEEVQEEMTKIFKDLIRLNTINEDENEMIAARYIEEIFVKEGIECEIIESKKGRGNVYARIKGGSHKAVILLSHLDVVNADEKKWDYEPFSAFENEGWIHGRGTLDTKQLTAMQMITMLLIKRQGVKLNRDLIFIASADEENGSVFGMKYLVENHKELFPEGDVLSEGGGFVIPVDNIGFRTCATGEKGLLEIKLIIRGNTTDEKVKTLSRVVHQIASYKSPEVLTQSAMIFQKLTKGVNSNKTLDDLWEYMTHHTLIMKAFDEKVQNMSERHEIELGCQFKFLPTIGIEEATEIIAKQLHGINDLSWEITESRLGYECNLSSNFYNKLKVHTWNNEKANKKTIVLPMIALGNTDGRFIENDVFGYSPILDDLPFSEVLKKVHGHNECISRESLNFGGKVIYELVSDLVKEK